MSTPIFDRLAQEIAREHPTSCRPSPLTVMTIDPAGRITSCFKCGYRRHRRTITPVAPFTRAEIDDLLTAALEVVHVLDQPDVDPLTSRERSRVEELRTITEKMRHA